MVSEYVSRDQASKVADLVVYLRLGDKSVAGDTTLTFDSGYYEAVLEKTRPKANTCWIVTVCITIPSSHTCV
jgi:hypothetical protein